MWRSKMANLQLKFFRWGFHRRAGSLCCCYMAPSCWLEVASPSPSVPFFLRDNSHQNLQEPCRVTRHPSHLLVCLLLVPYHSTCLSGPLPQAPNVGQSGAMCNCQVSQQEMWQSHAADRASPTSTLHPGFLTKEDQLLPPTHCPHLSCRRSASETSCVSKHVGSQSEARNGWQESGGSPGTTLSLLVCSLSRPLEAQKGTHELWWDALKYFQGLLEIAAALLAT